MRLCCWHPSEIQQLNPIIKPCCVFSSMCWKIAVTKPQGHISGLFNLLEEADSKYKITKALQLNVCLKLWP